MKQPVRLTSLKRRKLQYGVIDARVKDVVRRRAVQWELCRRSPHYFLSTFYYTLDRNAADKVRKFPDFMRDQRWHYIRVMLDQIQQENLIITLKSRRMLGSLITIGWYLWETMFLEARFTIFSRRKESDAEELLAYLRKSYKRLPPWMKALRPSSAEHKENKGRFVVSIPDRNTGEMIENVVQAVSAAGDEGRGETLTGVLADETAFQKEIADSVTAQIIALKGEATDMGDRHFISVTTVNGKNEVYKMSYDLDESGITSDMDGSGEGRHDLMPGLATWKNGINKFRILRLHYTADPSKRSAEWKTNAHAGITESRWKREYEIDFSANDGVVVYSAFDFDKHTVTGLGFKVLKHDKSLPLYRMFDFGYRRPACIFSQIGNDGRWYILAEFLGNNLPFFIFKNLMFHVSGVLERILETPDRARIDMTEKISQGRIENYRKLADIPVFNGCKQFYDAVDLHHGKQHNDKSGYETSISMLKRVRRVDSSLVHIKEKERPRTEGVDLVRQLLEQDRIVIDDQRCPILVEGMQSGYVYTDKEGSTQKELPDGDDFYSHLMDCMRYGAVNFFEFAEENKVVEFMREPSNEDFFNDPAYREMAEIRDLDDGKMAAYQEAAVSYG